MKDLFISTGEHISVGNFTDGTLTYREVPASEIAPLIEETRARGGVRNTYSSAYAALPQLPQMLIFIKKSGYWMIRTPKVLQSQLP